MTGRGKNFLLKVREGRELWVILSPEYHFKNRSERKKGERGARMSENLIYVDLNLAESTRPRLQKVTDVQGRSIGLHWAFFVFFSLPPTYFERVLWSTKAPKRTKKVWGPVLWKMRRWSVHVGFFTKKKGNVIRSAFHLLRCKCEGEFLVWY